MLRSLIIAAPVAALAVFSPPVAAAPQSMVWDYGFTSAPLGH